MVAINGKSSADGSSPGHPLLLESGDSLHARASLRRSERTPQDKPAGFIEVDGVRSVGRAWRAVLLLALVTLTLEWASASTWLGPWVPLFKGVDHAIGTNSPGGGGYPVVQRVHALRVDLSDPDVALFASPRSATYVPGVDETDGMTVSTFVATHHLQVAINANEFSPTNYYLPAGTAMNVHGWLVCTGQVVSVQDSADNAAAIFFDATNGASIIHTNWPATSPAGVFTAVSGTYPVLVAGVNVGYPYQNDPAPIHQYNPRTGFGLSQDRRYLYLLTIDGGQAGYSDGALDYQTAAWLILAGGYDGVNMDGGGSTTLVVADSTGRPVELNQSSAVADSGQQRTVGSHFGIYAKPLPRFINDLVATPDDTSATITWTTTAPATTQVQYGLTTNLGSASAFQPDPATNHTAVLSGLAPATSYYCKAISAVGATEYTSTNLVFTTTNYVTTNQLFDLSLPWRYTTANLDGRTWTARSYSDSSWLGSGPGLLWADVRPPQNQPPGVQPKGTQMPLNPNNSGYPFTTYYFRTHFNFTNGLDGGSLLFSAYVDDGAIFYLNGAEIYRLRMADAPTPAANSDLAIGFPCGGDADCVDQFAVSGDLTTNLVSGDNVLAVEVHNYTLHSADITFGMSLDYTETAAPRARLGITLGRGIVRLSWDRAGFILQQAPGVGGPWADVPGPVTLSPFTNSVANAELYFRLRK